MTKEEAQEIIAEYQQLESQLNTLAIGATNQALMTGDSNLLSVAHTGQQETLRKMDLLYPKVQQAERVLRS